MHTVCYYKFMSLLELIKLLKIHFLKNSLIQEAIHKNQETQYSLPSTVTVCLYIHTGFTKARSYLYFYDELSYYAITHKYEVFTSQAGVITTDMARHLSLPQQPK